jgi:uncharacterized membrane protein YfcA
LVAIIFTAISATAVNLRNERVRLMDGLVVGAGGVVGSVIGSRIALGTEETTLSLAFGCFVILVAAQSLLRVLRPRPAVTAGQEQGDQDGEPDGHQDHRPEPSSHSDDQVEHVGRLGSEEEDQTGQGDQQPRDE